MCIGNYLSHTGSHSCHGVDINIILTGHFDQLRSVLSGHLVKMHRKCPLAGCYLDLYALPVVLGKDTKGHLSISLHV